jgi:hypothetical protein
MPRLVLGAALTLLTVLVTSSPVAQAHPFGPPPRAWLATDGPTVTIVWHAAYDDHLSIGEHLGYFASGTAEAYLDPTVQVAPPRADEEELAASPALHDYLREHIVVEQGGERCDPEVLSTEGFVDEGARTRHHCAEPLDELTLRISMMHDINDAYRTFGLADGGAPGPFAVFTVEEPEHEVVLAELTDEAGPLRHLPLVLAVLLVGGLATLAFRLLTRDDDAR